MGPPQSGVHQMGPPLMGPPQMEPPQMETSQMETSQMVAQIKGLLKRGSSKGPPQKEGPQMGLLKRGVLRWACSNKDPKMFTNVHCTIYSITLKKVPHCPVGLFKRSLYICCTVIQPLLLVQYIITCSKQYKS